MFTQQLSFRMKEKVNITRIMRMGDAWERDASAALPSPPLHLHV